MTDELDEELYQPRPRGDRRWWALGVIVAAVIAAVVLARRDDHHDRPVARSTGVAPTSRAAPPAPAPGVVASLPVTEVVVEPPDPLVDAVREVFPKARLSALGLEVTADRDPARNYQFATARRRITVVVGRPDERPAVVRADLRAVVVVRTTGGHRVAVTVQAISGRVATGDARSARRLAGDARLLADP